MNTLAVLYACTICRLIVHGQGGYNLNYMYGRKVVCSECVKK